MEDFVTFEIAKKLKERGFVGDCEIGGYGGYYYHEGSEVYIQYDSDADNNCIGSDEYLRPTISQVLKWLREEKKLHIEIYTIGKRPIKWCHTIVELKHSGEAKGWTSGLNGTTYEETALAGIEYTLDNLFDYEQRTSKRGLH